MQKRYLSLWFRHLLTDWFTLRQPELKNVPFVLVMPERNRIIVTATNLAAAQQGITCGMTAADARAIVPDLQIKDHVPDLAGKILKAAAGWCIRYAPLISVDQPDGLLIDITGCTHLWGSEHEYLKEIVKRLIGKGYDVRGAIADTVGAAWAVARFGKIKPIIGPGEQQNTLLNLPPVALRLEPVVTERLHKLGFYFIKQFIGLKRSALRRRFGDHFLLRLDQALGNEDEPLRYIHPIEPYQERLPCLEPILTATGIEIAIKNLLEMLCKRLQAEGNALRIAILKCYRVDGKLIEVQVGTSRPSRHMEHLFKLFELKIPTIEPDLGIELFTMDALKVEAVSPEQELLWEPDGCGLEDESLAKLLDRITNRIGEGRISRYLPQESYWPEHSVKPARNLSERPATAWRCGKPRPSLLLKKPEKIEVTSLLPDNPPMLFIYKGERHVIKKADDAERIAREWWDSDGLHRDYYVIEDEAGRRYWVFRSGHYHQEESQWYLHGFFA